MGDCYFSEAGDIATNASGDIALTSTIWRDDAQQAYIRVMTDQGDFLIFPTLGASLSNLFGMPQSPATGQYGTQLIRTALEREGVFAGKIIDINAVPVSVQTIRFDINIKSGNLEEIRLSVEQNLGIENNG